MHIDVVASISVVVASISTNTPLFAQLEMAETLDPLFQLLGSPNVELIQHSASIIRVLIKTFVVNRVVSENSIVADFPLLIKKTLAVLPQLLGILTSSSARICYISRLTTRRISAATTKFLVLECTEFVL